MVCPKCGKSTSDNKDFCDHCGAALIGPQSIYLNEPNFNHKIDKNNISSITGIDINEINQSTSAFSDFHVSMEDTNSDNEKSKAKIKIDFKLILLFILMLIIFGLSIYIITRPSSNNMSTNSKKCDNTFKTVTEYIGHKVTTSNYTFTIPDGYDYSENTNTTDVVIRGNNAELIIYPIASGRLDNVTSASILAKYNDYSDADIEETVLKQRKIYLVSYSSNENYYIDFYYQFSGEKIVYGQGKSSAKDIINGTEVRNIIASIGIRQEYNNLVYDASGFNQENVLSSLK